MTNAFYVQCSACVDHFAEFPQDKKLCDDIATGINLEYESRFGGREVSTRAGSLTDATTIETTGANTPIVIDDDDIEMIPLKKRKLSKAEPLRRAKKDRLVY
jgi:SWI/SNF-related matrix-associated actin-dependent regulator of chromatin subfamily A member 5